MNRLSMFEKIVCCVCILIVSVPKCGIILCFRQHLWVLSFSLKECFFEIFLEGIAMTVLSVRMQPINRTRNWIPRKRIIGRMVNIVRMWMLLAGEMSACTEISTLIAISYIHRIANHTSSILILFSSTMPISAIIAPGLAMSSLCVNDLIASTCNL